MTNETGGKAAVVKPTAARQGVRDHNMRYVLGVSMFGVIAAFAAVGFYVGGKFAI